MEWRVLAQLEHAFSTMGAMPRPSAAEAHATGVPMRSLVAGEITWPGIFGMLQFADAAPGESFLDCGAGHGRAVAAFSLAFSGRSYGVEIRPRLVKTAQHCLVELQRSRAAWIARDIASLDTVNTTVMPAMNANVMLGDMFAPELDWCAYDIVLVNATGFDDDLMLRCSQKLQATQLPPQLAETAWRGRQRSRRYRGRRVLVLSQPLPPPCPAPVSHRTFKMSWGQCTVFLHQQ